MPRAADRHFVALGGRCGMSAAGFAVCRQRHPVLAVLAGAVCGLGVLAVMALLEPVSGIALPLNRYTAFVAAVLGVPGVVLLLLLQLIL